MTRLPIPGSDDGKWGQILNEYLSQSLDASGNLKAGTVGGSQLQDGSVTSTALADNAVTNAKLADASVTSAKFAPGAVTKADVGLGSVDNTSDVDKPVSSAMQTALNTKLNTADLDSQTAAKISDSGSATGAALSASTDESLRTKALLSEGYDYYADKPDGDLDTPEVSTSGANLTAFTVNSNWRFVRSGGFLTHAVGGTSAAAYLNTPDLGSLLKTLWVEFQVDDEDHETLTLGVPLAPFTSQPFSDAAAHIRYTASNVNSASHGWFYETLDGGSPVTTYTIASRTGDDRPAPLTPGKTYRLQVDFLGENRVLLTLPHGETVEIYDQSGGIEPRRGNYGFVELISNDPANESAIKISAWGWVSEEGATGRGSVPADRGEVARLIRAAVPGRPRAISTTSADANVSTALTTSAVTFKTARFVVPPSGKVLVMAQFFINAAAATDIYGKFAVAGVGSNGQFVSLLHVAATGQRMMTLMGVVDVVTPKPGYATNMALQVYMASGGNAVFVENDTAAKRTTLTIIPLP